MTFQVDMVAVLEIVIIVLTLKLIVQRWKPPMQESMQCIVCLIIGTGVGGFLNPTKEGILIGFITSAISFYGKTLITEFTDLKEELEESGLDEIIRGK